MKFMRNNLVDRVVQILKIIIVVVIASILLVAAIGKLLDNRHFADVLAQWRLFPEWSLLGLGVIGSLAELLLALWLLSGKQLPKAALVSVLFHLCYSLATTITVLRGIQLPDCGCFGIFFKHPLDWKMVRGDLFFTLLSFLLYVLAKKWPRPLWRMAKTNH